MQKIDDDDDDDDDNDDDDNVYLNLSSNWQSHHLTTLK
jgi:hypothetical protein